MYAFLMRAPRTARQVALVLLALFTTSTGAFAQVTPIFGAVTETEGASREHVSDDILRDTLNAHQAFSTSGDGKAFTSFALGRIRSSNQESLGVADVAGSVATKSDESSAFGAIAYRGQGLQPGSFFSLSSYVGETSINTRLGAQPTPIFGFIGPTGTSKNNAVLGGIGAAYSIGNFYVGGTFTYFGGKTDVDQTTPGTATLGGSFDTSGYMASGAIGGSGEVATIMGARTFLTGEVGLRRVDMTSDYIFNRERSAQFKADFTTVTGSATIGLFAILPVGAMSVRPFIRLSALHDFQYDNVETILGPTGLLLGTDNYTRYSTMGQFEGGMSVVSGNINLSASGFTEWAGDRSAVGGKFGLRYDF